MGRLVAVCLLAAAAAVAWSVTGGSADQETGVGPAPFDLERDGFVLGREAQRRIWSIEAVASALQVGWGPLFRRVLQTGDVDRWRSFCTDGFTATLPAGPAAATVQGGVQFATWRKGATRRTDADGLFAWLRAKVDAGLAVVEFHVDELAPVERGALDRGAWAGTWSMSLRSPDPGRETVLKFRVAYAHLDRRIHAGRAFLASVATELEETRAAPGGAPFADVTAGTGIRTELLTDTWRRRGPTVFHGAHLLDYDRDGTLDVFLVDRPESFLYRGRGDATFQDTTLAAGLLAPPGAVFLAATVADLDNDGYEDLVAQIEDRFGARPVVYRNLGTGAFRRLRDGEVDLPRVHEGNAAVADYDGDGLVDLYFPNSGAAVPREVRAPRWIGDRTAPAGVLLRNRGGFRFEDVTEKAGAAGGHREVLGAAWCDLEPDGDPDLVLVNHLGENAILENRGDGTFAERPFAHPFGGFSMGVAVGDLDEDGDPDFFIANMSSRAGQRIVRNLDPSDYPPGVHAFLEGFVDGNAMCDNAGGTVRRAALHTGGWAYGPALLDLDGDGRLDIYCPAGFQSVDPRQPDG